MLTQTTPPIPEFRTTVLATVGGEWPEGTEETIILGAVAFTTPSGIFVACVKGAKGWFLQHDLMAPPMSFTAAMEAARLWLLQQCAQAAYPLPEGWKFVTNKANEWWLLTPEGKNAGYWTPGDYSCHACARSLLSGMDDVDCLRDRGLLIIAALAHAEAAKGGKD